MEKYETFPLSSPRRGLGEVLNFLEPEPGLFTGRKAEQGSNVFETYFDLTHTQLRFIFDQILKQSEDQLERTGDTENEHLTFEQVRKALEVVGLQVQDQELFADLMKKVDIDQDQLISFQEFETIVQSLKLEYLFRTNRDATLATLHSREPVLRCNEFSVGKYSGVARHADIKAFLYSDREAWATNRWIHVTRPNPFVLKALTIKYRLHPLALEAILEPTRYIPMRARLEHFDRQLFVVFPTLGFDMVDADTDASATPRASQRSAVRYARGPVGSQGSLPKCDEAAPLLGEPAQPVPHAPVRQTSWRGSGRGEPVVGPGDMRLPVVHRGTLGMFLTFPECDTLITISDGVDPGVIHRAEELLRVPYSRPRSQNAMFLLYALIDLAVDNYALLIEAFADTLSDLRGHLRERTSMRSLLSRSHEDTLFYAAQHHVSGEILTVRRWLQPASRVVQHLLEEHHVDNTLTVYLRDVRDHLEQVNDDLTCLLDDCRSIKEEYDHSIEVKQNSAMTVVTLLATTFLPAQFLTGVFGMNFKMMPELQWEYGYPLFWALCFLSWITIFALYKWRF